MPRLTRWCLRAALLYLIAGFTVGALLLAATAGWRIPGVWRFLDLHVEFLLLGWTTQLAIGVAYWILPRHRAGPKRGGKRLPWSAFLLLNAGILAVGAAPVVGAALAVPGRLAELGGILAFSVHAWPRVRSAASRITPPVSGSGT